MAYRQETVKLIQERNADFQVSYITAQGASGDAESVLYAASLGV
jgi:hypothetical protein